MAPDNDATRADGAPDETAPVPDRILVWDLPTRVFHWTLVACFFTALVTGDHDRVRDLHVFCGYVMLGLIVFRVVWGFAGTRYARFGSFPFAPRAAIAYGLAVLRARAARHLGHNPAGSLAIYLLLALGGLLCVTGIVVLGAEESQGIFRSLDNRPLGDFVRALHEVLAWSMFALVLAHVGGVVVESLLHRENLARAMFNGRKQGDAGAGIGRAHGATAAAMVVCIAASALWLLHWRLTEIPGLERLPYVGRQLPDNKAWREACSTCHVPYHPSLLPKRSWQAHFAQPQDHFGVQWEFDPRTLAQIGAFVAGNAAENGLTEAAYKINLSIPAGQTPLRITDTPYWIDKHATLDAAVWDNPAVGTRSNCAGCHRDAEIGTYEDAAMRLPQPPAKK